MTIMGPMFGKAYAFNQALALWDISSVTDMRDMFESAATFNQVLCWSISSATDTTRMFQGSNTTYATAIDNPGCPLTASPSLTPSLTLLPSSLVPSHKPTSSPTLPPSHLATPITNSTSLQTAIGVWCQNLTRATENYGDISTWYVMTKSY